MQAEVGAWLRRRTTSGQDWDREQLARAKHDTTISVVLPARNEAGTVGLIVDELRRELIERVPLIDELVVMDSGSVDETAVVAAEAGARVVRQSDVLAPLVDQPGKGEALWKSLYVTRGDVVVFIDADLEQFDPQFAVGLMGPLLADPTVEFVKAFYDRPLQAGQTSSRPAAAG